MKFFKFFQHIRENGEPLVMDIARTLLFLLFFCFSLMLSSDGHPIIYGITTGGMGIYALIIIGTFISWLRKQ